jgi:hypothetical protein
MQSIHDEAREFFLVFFFLPMAIMLFFFIGYVCLDDDHRSRGCLFYSCWQRWNDCA